MYNLKSVKTKSTIKKYKKNLNFSLAKFSFKFINEILGRKKKTFFTVFPNN